MNFEVGKYYKTREGKKVIVYANFYDQLFTIHGAILYPGDGWIINSWTVNGRSFGDGAESENDLVSEWIEPVKPLEFWANVYRSDVNHKEFTLGCETKHDAELLGDETRRIRTALFREVIE